MTRHFLLSFFISVILLITTQAIALSPTRTHQSPAKLTFSQATLDKVHQFQVAQQQRLKNLSLNTKSLALSAETITNDNSNNDINFLDIQLSDALNFLTNIKIAALSTKSMLLEMKKAAAEVAAGTYSQDDNERYNTMFQRYKEILGFMQHIDSFAGDKTVSGGSIYLSFEDNNGKHDTYTVVLPAFNPQALSLNALNTLSQKNAQEAIDTIENDIKTLERVTVQMDNYIDDLEALILSIPSVLATDYIIFNRMIELSMQAFSDPYNLDDKALLDMQFTTLKQEMDKSQIIPTLNGPIRMTGGQLRIQVGEESTDDHVVTIRLPDVNLVNLSLDRSHINTNENTYATLDTLQNAMRHFVYYN